MANTNTTKNKRDKSRNWKAALAALGIVALGMGGCHARALIDGLPTEADAPELEIESWANGGDAPIELSELRGKPVVLEFWSTQCPPRVKNLPKIKRIARGYGNDIHVVTVHVSLDKDSAEQDEQQIRAYLAKAGIDCPVGIDREGKQWKRFDFHYLPHMVLIDAEGKVAWSGNLLLHDAEKKVRRAFGEPRHDAGTLADEAMTVMAPVEGACEGGVCAPK
ncbi:MAG: TlpA family protein disulfide reductase [Planctomycetota bacterium]|jgi:thiol-disulfide isomerase/thioredoxin